MIRNVVFDMGCVLLDYRPVLPCLRHAQERALAQKLCDAIFNTPDWGELIDGGVMNEQEYLAVVQQRLNTPAEKALASAILRDWHLDALFPKNGMQELTQQLLEHGAKLYLLSNVGFGFSNFCYKIPNLERFSGLMLSCQEKMLKPTPAIYERLCSRFDLVPEECVFVDDLPANIAGAQKVGLHGYCFADGDVPALRETLMRMLEQK